MSQSDRIENASFVSILRTPKRIQKRNPRKFPNRRGPYETHSLSKKKMVIQHAKDFGVKSAQINYNISEKSIKRWMHCGVDNKGSRKV